jgi:hypothetical protein
MKKRNPREQGQVIILLVAGIISLLGFTALAVDGARLYTEHRQAQGVSDTAAFTAAAYIGQYELDYIKSNWSSGDDVESHATQAALDRIRSNGYTDAAYDPFSPNDRLSITIEPYPDAGDLAGTIEFIVKVFLISEVDPVFAQLVYDGDLLVNVESHVIVNPGVPTDIGFGNAMYALDDFECKAIEFTGNGDIDISGAGIYADSECTNPGAIDFGGNSDIDIDGTVTTPGIINEHGSVTVTTGGEFPGADRNEFPDLPVPDCSGLPINPVVVPLGGNSFLYQPGIYTIEVSSQNNETNDFQPGMYCLEGGFRANGGVVTGNDVMFYLPSGDINISAQADVTLTAPTAGQADDSKRSWDGMLFYVLEGGVTINGGAGSYLEGTVFAPDPSETCKLNGGSETITYNLQLVCNTITVNGGAGLDIVFDNLTTWKYDPPPVLDLIQ